MVGCVWVVWLGGGGQDARVGLHESLGCAACQHWFWLGRLGWVREIRHCAQRGLWAGAGRTKADEGGHWGDGVGVMERGMPSFTPVHVCPFSGRQTLSAFRLPPSAAAPHHRLCKAPSRASCKVLVLLLPALQVGAPEGHTERKHKGKGCGYGQNRSKLTSGPSL